MTHAEFQPGRSDCPGNLTVIYHLSRRSGQYAVYRCQQCQWTNAPYRRRWGTQTETPPTPEAHMRTLKLSLNRKAGAPNYGSDGVGMELSIEIPDDQGMSGIPEIALTYYAMIEHTINLQLERMSARHTDAGPARQVEPAPVRQPGPVPPRSESREPRRWDPDNLLPAPAREPEPGPPQTRNGNGNGYSAPRSDPWKGGKPTTGGALWKWACSQGKDGMLRSLAKEVDRGAIRDWDPELVAWAVSELDRGPVGAPGSSRWGDRN